MLDVIGLDHLYLCVSELPRSERFYDPVMQLLGFRKGDKPIGGDPHAHYFNRVMQLSLRPARSAARHDPYAPGVHHVCLQLADRQAVEDAVVGLRAIGVEATAPKLYPEYNLEYYASFLEDPDGIRLELVARTAYRDALVERWDELEGFLNPFSRLPERPR